MFRWTVIKRCSIKFPIVMQPEVLQKEVLTTTTSGPDRAQVIGGWRK